MTTCNAEFAMKNTVVLMHFFCVTLMSQKARTGLQEKTPTMTVSVAQAMLMAPIILVASLMSDVGNSER